MIDPARLPPPRVPDPRSAPSLRWGVLGTGWIAERFVSALQRHSSQRVVAVGSRTKRAAEEFASRAGIPTAHGSYEALVGDRQVDVVYVATPHNLHHACGRLALQAGKHVVLEKPLALNARQAADFADLASRQDRFCMEAMWTFFLPRLDVVRRVLADGLLGDLRSVVADHGEYFPASHRIMRHELAGGPLLDLGTYPVALATWVLGPPRQVTAVGQPAPSGVNGQTSAILRHEGDNQSVVHTTLFSHTPTAATIAGTAGTLVLPGRFYSPGDVELVTADLQRATYTEPAMGHEALHFQAAEAARCIEAGERESTVRPLADSIATLKVLDEIRRQIGVTFAEERDDEQERPG